ncbi:unnamed protein product [Arctogadus glacialis]
MMNKQYGRMFRFCYIGSFVYFTLVLLQSERFNFDVNPSTNFVFSVLEFPIESTIGERHELYQWPDADRGRQNPLNQRAVGTLTGGPG